MPYVLRIAAIVIVGSLVGVTSRTTAAEPGEIRARAKTLRAEAAELSAQGRKQEAAKPERVLEELSTTADKVDDKLKLSGKAHVGDKKGGVKEPREVKRLDAKGLQDGAKKSSGKRPKSAASPDSAKDTAQRVKHLRTAAQHLKAARMPELSSKIWSEADRVEAEVERTVVKKRSADAGDKAEGTSDMKSLRQEVMRLKAELADLRQRVQ